MLKLSAEVKITEYSSLSKQNAQTVEKIDFYLEKILNSNMIQKNEVDRRSKRGRLVEYLFKSISRNNESNI